MKMVKDKYFQYYQWVDNTLVLVGFLLKNGYNITKQKSKKSNSHEQFPKTKKHPKKMNLVTIEIAPNYPI